MNAHALSKKKALLRDIDVESQTKIYKGRPWASHSVGAKLCLHFEPKAPVGHRGPPAVAGGARRSAPLIHVTRDLTRKRYWL